MLRVCSFRGIKSRSSINKPDFAESAALLEPGAAGREDAGAARRAGTVAAAVYAAAVGLVAHARGKGDASAGLAAGDKGEADSLSASLSAAALLTALQA